MPSRSLSFSEACGVLLRSGVVLLLLAGCGTNAPSRTFVPSPTEVHLVELMSQRLELARHVAWAKFQSDAKVSDPKRESELLAALELQARESGLSEKIARNFFEAQILASRQVQEKLISNWKRGGALPAIPPMDLRLDIRPRLAMISQELLRDLAVTEKTPFKPGLAGYAEQTLAARGFSPSIARQAAAPLRVR